MLRPRSNSTWIWVWPSELVELIAVTPEISDNWLSSGAATEVAMVSALAPGRLADHPNGRDVDLRHARDRQHEIGHQPQQRDADHHQRRRDRPNDERRGDVHQKPSADFWLGVSAGSASDLDQAAGLDPVLTVGDHPLAGLRDRHR